MASSEGGGGRGEGVVGRGGRSRQVVLRVEMHWRQRLGVAHLLFIGMIILMKIEELTEGLYKAEGRREDGAIREALPSRQSRWSRGLELERSRPSRGDGKVVVEDGSSLSRSIILIHLNHSEHNDDDQRYLRQRGGGVEDGEPGVGVPAMLPPPTSISSWAGCLSGFYHDVFSIHV